MSRYRIYHLGISLMVSALLFLTGCGGSDEIPRAPVSGRITMDGEPLANVSVTFQPIVETGQVEDTGGGSFGKTDEEGNYSLEFVATGETGAVVGKHRVSISTPQPEEAQQDDAFEFEDPIPARYNTHTELTFEVPPDGTEEADFALTSDRDELDKKH